MVPTPFVDGGVRLRGQACGAEHSINNGERREGLVGWAGDTSA
jgi:hypothetical protein